MTVIRPAESYEVAHAWAAILKQDGPAAIFLTRQNVQNIPEELRGNIDVARGGYVLSDDKDFNVILIATGSEVMLAYEVAQKLRADGCRVRVVSMPSCELFLRQDKAYRDQVLPPDSHKRVTIEAATTIGWERFAGDQGLMIGIDHFGDSAPAEVLVEKYGLTAEAIIARIHSHFCCGPTCA
jgi:transketolase